MKDMIDALEYHKEVGNLLKLLCSNYNRGEGFYEQVNKVCSMWKKIEEDKHGFVEHNFNPTFIPYADQD